MKTVFLSVNSKYIHTLLAPRYLVAGCNGLDIEIYETNINVLLNDVITDVYLLKPDVIAVSAYIFNVNFVESFCVEIKKVLPNVKIVAGGWEAACNPSRFLRFVDVVLVGEGDLAFNKLLHDLDEGKTISGVIDCGIVENLDDIISPYSEEYLTWGKEKILYYESSRGCPFSCKYCMSGSSKGVRSFSLERIYSDLNKIVSSKPKLIKFVDRTFNYNLKRACQIFSYIIDNFSECGVSFHFEMAPELFNEEMFSILKCAKKGLFQFEIGVQSYNDKTLVAISRKANSGIVDSNIFRIINLGNIPVHVDLIAGLFYENLQSFIDGFNRLISLSPNELQLGFLKILNGSKMAEEADGYVYSHQAPYEIYSTPWLSFDDVVELKRVESVLNVYYNSGKFTSSLSYLFTLIDDKYSFFKELYNYIFSNGYLVKELSFNKKCDALYYFSLNYFSEEVLESSYLEELIAKDFLNAGNVRTWHKRPLSHING